MKMEETILLTGFILADKSVNITQQKKAKGLNFQTFLEKKIKSVIK